VAKQNNDDMARRVILLGGLATIGSFLSTSTHAQEKIPQEQVQYQKTPKDGKMCSACVNYVAPASCKIVAGTIAPYGWCIAFAPRQANAG
jgi:hypothetical protein